MNVKQMDEGLQIGVQKINSNAFLSYDPHERLYFLNKAQRSYIRRQHLSYREKFVNSKPGYVKEKESAEALAPFLRQQVIAASNVAAHANFENAVTADISSYDVYYYVHSMSQPESGGDWHNNKLISPNQIHKYIRTASNFPTFRVYPVLLQEDNIVAFYDAEGGGIHQLLLTYIRTPKELVFDSPSSNQTTTSELPSTTHDDVVNLAVAMLLEDLKASRPNKPTQVAPSDEQEV